MKIKKQLIWVIIAALSVNLGGCGNTGSNIESKRNISVEEVNGDTVVTSQSKQTDAYKGMQLISGDCVEVKESSDLTLLIDMDKHLYANQNTRFAIEALNESKLIKTRIVLEDGCTLIGIDNKLGANESFKVSTPNATMAVRGTVFYVTVSDSEEGKKTELVVKEGSVEVKTIENGYERTDIVSEGQTVTYFGQAPDDGVTEQVSDNSAGAENVTISSKDIPENRDGSKGVYGVYRGGNYTVVIVKDVVYAYNRADGIIVDEDINRPFCVATVTDGDEPFFAREAQIVSDTLITDFTYRDDVNDHVMDMEYYVDGDTLYYRQVIKESDSDVCIVLKRTSEDPKDVYMSYITGDNSDNGEVKNVSQGDIDRYLNDMGLTGVEVKGSVHEFDEYYGGDPEYERMKDSMKTWSSIGWMMELSSPVTIDGNTFTECGLGYDSVFFHDIDTQVQASGSGMYYGYFQPYRSGDSNPDEDVTEKVIGTPTYVFSVIECR